jgi:purine-nucleoside phosphorylase
MTGNGLRSRNDMLKDLSRADWIDILKAPAERLPAAVILRGTRNLGARYRSALPLFSNVHELGAPNGIIEDVLIGDVHGRAVGFACVYGAAMASEIVHIFGMLGSQAVIQIGNCGALADGFVAGDLFVAERAFCGEGAAQYYKKDGSWIDARPGMLGSRALAGLGAKDSCLRGAIYTTGALFAEGMDDIERWHADGFAAVDMETAATYAVAEYFGMDRIALLYAFDNPRQREHLLLSDAEKDKRRSTADQRMMSLALDLAVEVAGR